MRHDGLVETEATNQGAWLTESAGALSDLHASLLESISGFNHEGSLALYDSLRPPPVVLVSSERGRGHRNVGKQLSKKHERCEGQEYPAEKKCGAKDPRMATTTQEGYRDTRAGGGDCPERNKLFLHVACHFAPGIAEEGERYSDHVGGGDVGESDDRGDCGPFSDMSAGAAVDRSDAEKQDRERLFDLARLLAHKRQFAASRRVKTCRTFTPAAFVLCCFRS